MINELLLYCVAFTSIELRMTTKSWQCRTLARAPTGGRRRSLRAFLADRSATTAIEFGIVGLPFFMLMIGILGVCFYFFTTLSLETAVETAGRLIRTGQAQTANFTADQFKTSVCNASPAYLDCTNNLRVSVTSYTTFSSITLPNCMGNDNALLSDNQMSYSPGSASTVVLVVACYKWDLAGSLPFINLGTFGDGAALIQAATTFRSEPYTN